MAAGRNSAAAYAAAVWCARNLFMESVEASKKQDFKNTLASVIRQTLNKCDSDETCCVIAITNGKPNKPLKSAMEQYGITDTALATKDILVRVYRNKVYADIGEPTSDAYVSQPIFFTTEERA